MAFKRNGLAADISKEFLNHLILRNILLQSLDNIGANFIGLDQHIDDLRVVERNTSGENSLEICFSIAYIGRRGVMGRWVAGSAAHIGIVLDGCYAWMFRRRGRFHVRGSL